MDDTGKKLLALVKKGGRIGLDQFAPGVTELYKELQQERARRFIEQLEAASELQRIDAESALGSMLSAEGSRTLLLTVVRDILFGSERISLAALALLASRLLSETPTKVDLAARAIDGMSDLFASTFISLLNKLESMLRLTSKWRVFFQLEVSGVNDAQWQFEREMLGLDAELMVLAVEDLIRRGLLLPDSTGRGAADRICFGLRTRTLWYYELLYRAAHLADPTIVDASGWSTPEGLSARPLFESEGVKAATRRG
jgi:hypothetical protein